MKLEERIEATKVYMNGGNQTDSWDSWHTLRNQLAIMEAIKRLEYPYHFYFDEASGHYIRFDKRTGTKEYLVLNQPSRDKP